MTHLHFGECMVIIEGQRGTRVILLHFGGFMSIVEGQGEAGDKGMIHLHYGEFIDCRGLEKSWRHKG